MISEKENQSFEEWNESADLGRGNISEGAPRFALALPPGTVTSASPSSFRYLRFHLQIEKDSKALATSESMILPGREVRSLIYPHVTGTNQPTLGHICGTDIISTIKCPTPPLAKPGTQAST